jgi:hypothetical protein
MRMILLEIPLRLDCQDIKQVICDLKTNALLLELICFKKTKRLVE